MHYVGTRASDTNPLRSLPLYTPAARVLGWAPLDKARAVLVQEEQELVGRRTFLAAAYAKLGRANRCPSVGMRRQLQAAAMRSINAECAAMRAANAALRAARAEVARLEAEPAPLTAPARHQDGPAPGLPGYVKVLRDATATFPAGTVAKVDRSPVAGWHAVIRRPNGAGIATHHDAYRDALAWVDAQLAAPTWH